MKKLVIAILLSFQYIIAGSTCAYNNINIYSSENNVWMLLGQYGETKRQACPYKTSIRVHNIESYYITDRGMLIFTMTSGETYILESGTADFSRFNEILLHGK